MADLFPHRKAFSKSSLLFALCGLLLCAWLAALSLEPGQKLEQGLWLDEAPGLGLSGHAGDRAPPDELLSARSVMAKRRIEPFRLQLPEVVAVLVVALWFIIFALPSPIPVPRFPPEGFSPPLRHPRLRRSGVSRAPPAVS